MVDKDRCRHWILYDGKNIKLRTSGLTINFDNVKIEPKILEATVHALLLLDADQYQLCQSIKILPTEEVKTEYYQRMIEDQMRIQNITQAISALLIDPQNELIQNTVRDVLLSSLGHVSSDNASRQDLMSELESHSKRSEHETKEEILDKANLDKKIEDLKESYPQVTTKKVYRPGVIKVQLASQSKREYERISSEISDKIKNIPGVINVWFAGGKNFNLLVDIEVTNPEEGENIESKIKSITGVENAKVYTASELEKNA